MLRLEKIRFGQPDFNPLTIDDSRTKGNQRLLWNKK
jgi:hypothetical protein